MSGFYSSTAGTATGSFTPVIAGTSSAGAGTYTAQEGTYAKVGSAVFFRIRLGWSAHTGTGNMKVTGLPFTSGATHNFPVDFYIITGLSWSNTLQGAVPPETSEVVLTTVASTGGATSLALDTAADIVVSGFYLV